jgi:hypothetical protein
LLSSGGLRAPALSLRVTRDDEGLEEFESFIQFVDGSLFELAGWLYRHSVVVVDILEIGCDACTSPILLGTDVKYLPTTRQILPEANQRINKHVSANGVSAGPTGVKRRRGRRLARENAPQPGVALGRHTDAS